MHVPGVGGARPFPHEAKQASVEPTYDAKIQGAKVDPKKPSPFDHEGAPLGNAPEEVKTAAKDTEKVAAKIFKFGKV